MGRVYLRVGEVALALGKRNMREMAQATSLAYTTVHAIVRHPERSEAISFEVLARLCAYLGCGPGNILGYGPPGDYALCGDGALGEEYEPPAPRPLSAQWRQLGPDEEAPGQEEEGEDYVLPEQWRRLHADAPLSLAGAWVSEQDAGLRRQEWDCQAAVPGSEPEQPMPPRQVGLYESI